MALILYAGVTTGGLSMKWIKSGIFLCCLSCFIFNSTLQAKKSADYIVIGVGNAGAVVAKMLSDNHKNSVIALHIDSNLSDDPLIKFSAFTPITVAAGLFGPPLYEAGETVPQPNADNRELNWAVALPLGGASAVNAGALVRGTNQVYAQWEALAGPNWSVNRILGIYKALETYHGTSENPEFRGNNGPIDVLQPLPVSAVSQKFTNAIVNGTGVPLINDYNDPLLPIGASTQVQITRNGPDGSLRVSSATAFLNSSVMTPDGKGVNGRKLRVFFDSPALRIIWKGNKAVGVEYVTLTDSLDSSKSKCGGPKVKKVYAKKGIIVSAGLFSSPFLMHSGVGPRALLESFNIPVVFDNPNVGQGLVDQPSVRTVFTTDPDDASLDVNVFFSQISGLPAPGGDPTVRLIRIASAPLIPGIQLVLFDLVQPLSRGSVTIGSADPLAPPIIDLGTLSNPADLTLFQQGFQIYLNNINNFLVANYPGYELVFPDPSILTNPVLTQDFIRENIACNEHFQSHCRMAPQDQGGVVDGNGRVYGVQNLYVADDSIVPLCMDGSPMASAYLIGANVAQLIIDAESQGNRSGSDSD